MDQPETTKLPSVAALRHAWQQAYGSAPPAGLGRELLARAISWKEQERTHGGMSVALARELSRLARQLDRSGELDVERQLSLKTGTRLVREWNGRTCHVTVLEEGFLFEDQCYSSLTQIARVVTGAHWSGPRFFGLRQRPRIPGKGADAHV